MKTPGKPQRELILSHATMPLDNPECQVRVYVGQCLNTRETGHGHPILIGYRTLDGKSHASQWIAQLPDWAGASLRRRELEDSLDVTIATLALERVLAARN